MSLETLEGASILHWNGKSRSPLTLSTPSHLGVPLPPPPPPSLSQESPGCQTAYIVSYGSCTTLLPAQAMGGVFMCRVVGTSVGVWRDTLDTPARRQPDDTNRTVLPPRYHTD